MKKSTALSFLVLLLLGAACSQPAPNAEGTASRTRTLTRTPTPTITPTPTPSPAEILAKSGDAVLAMKSARFTLVREGPPIQFDPTTGMGFAEAAGEYQAPDRVSAKAKVTLFGNMLELEIYWLPEGVFILNPLTKQLQEAPADMGIDAAAMFTPEGIPAVLKTGIQNPQRIGYETVEDVKTIHIRGQADGAVLSPLMAGALESGTLYPVDAWVEVSTYYLVRFHITEPDGNGWMIDIFDINTPIEIRKP
jgi:lipoprotein LprG